MDKNSIKCGLEDTLTLLHDIRRLDSVFIGSPFYVHLLSASYAIPSSAKSEAEGITYVSPTPISDK